jgi:hemoglobin
MRHIPFPIGQPERDAWLRHIRAAVNASDAAPADARALLDYFESASTSLINRQSSP